VQLRRGGEVRLVNPRRPFTITKVERHEDGYWTARVTANGDTIRVDNKWGSWQATVPEVVNGARVTRRHVVLPQVAVELQRKVKLAERREAAPA
jgi:hypothetical protein